MKVDTGKERTTEGNLLREIENVLRLKDMNCVKAVLILRRAKRYLKEG